MWAWPGRAGGRGLGGRGLVGAPPLPPTHTLARHPAAAGGWTWPPGSPCRKPLLSSCWTLSPQLVLGGSRPLASACLPTQRPEGSNSGPASVLTAPGWPLSPGIRWSSHGAAEVRGSHGQEDKREVARAECSGPGAWASGWCQRSLNTMLLSSWGHRSGRLGPPPLRHCPSPSPGSLPLTGWCTCPSPGPGPPEGPWP